MVGETNPEARADFLGAWPGPGGFWGWCLPTGRWSWFLGPLLCRAVTRGSCWLSGS